MLVSTTKLYRVLFFTWCLLLCILSVIPLSAGESKTGYSSWFRGDYLFHYCAFFLLGWLLIMWRKSKNGNRFSILVFSLIVGLFLAFVMEWQQRYMPGRSWNIKDLWLNTAGVITGVLFGFSCQKLNKNPIKLFEKGKKEKKI